MIYHPIVESKTTDKLNILSNIVHKAISADPTLTKRLKSVQLEWRTVDYAAVPFINIQFSDPVPEPKFVGGTVG